ncbi:TOMM precursor leader peptide-binding protein [Streptomyces oryzae]|uniref:TOMM leader peptide-binding protein n=1 Tax=Streptomyces oryzae TaxID=1434886 RepID=A0ABS3XCR2_9ACTN|nr:TOMM precursor leader peptide-binding protein [Streptomyces oryzae]MBO8193172.1 TOMM precursor leader peptide-binding protein [Streptomyces oryzae]
MEMETAPPRLGFRKNLRPAVVPGDATYLISEQGVTAVEGAAMAALAPLLDGSRDLAELTRETRGLLSPGQLGSLLGQLAEANLVAGFAPAPPASGAAAAQSDATSAFWESAGLNGVRAGAELSAGRVRLLTVASGEDHRAARDAFRAAGLRLAEADESDGHTLTVVLCEDYLSPVLADIDAAQRRAGRPWLLAKPYGVEPWIGPFFEPHESACWHCLAHRLRHHRTAHSYVGEALGLSAPVTPPRAHIPASRACALQLLALQAAAWLGGFRDARQSAVWTLDSLRGEGRHHPVERRPQCPACGDPTLVAARVRQPVTLVSRPKVATGGGHRSLSGREMLQRYEHLVGEVTGVVRLLQRDPRCPDDLNAFVSGSNPALRGNGVRTLHSALRSHSAGKGVTELDAKVGALCEALERYSGTFQGDEARVPGRYAELGEAAVHPNSCQLYDERQFAGRREWNALHSPFQFVCDPFDESAVLDWTPVWSLTERRHRLLPTAMLYFATPQHTGAPVFARADSNGNAAGSSLEDAILQGFLELVERDAVALWWYNRTRQPQVDPESFGEEWICRMRASYAALGREFWVLDLTSDLGIPVMCALSRRTGRTGGGPGGGDDGAGGSGGREDIVFGFGCHLDPALALRRALTEMTQMLPAVLDTELSFEDPVFRDWCIRRRVADQHYLAPDPEAAVLQAGDYTYTPRADLREDVSDAVTLLRRRGMDMLVLDQTRPDLGIPVVKVIVPGLRHFWARFAPGRLFDVPVRLGRLDRPTDYNSLNPIPVFV